MKILDVPGAYLNSVTPEDNKILLLKPEDAFVDIMCEVNLQIKKDVQQEGKKNVLNLGRLKALYGCFEFNLIWYHLYKDTLKEDGFRFVSI